MQLLNKWTHILVVRSANSAAMMARPYSYERPGNRISSCDFCILWQKASNSKNQGRELMKLAEGYQVFSVVTPQIFPSTTPFEMDAKF